LGKASQPIQYHAVNRASIMSKKSTRENAASISAEIEQCTALDTTALLKRCDASIAQAQSLIKEFLEDTKSDLVEFDRAMSCGDVAKLASMAYRISNLASSIGARQTHLVTKALETSCRKGHYEALPLHVARFRHTQTSLAIAVLEFCGKSK
jgi:HPt (histidine-containing phosphotransfer) domain-containing protein